jgi:Na+/H+ antiporter NhaC
MKESGQQKYAETYGGRFGAVFPLVMMLAGMLILSLLGYRSTKSLWGAGLLAVVAGYFVYKDKKRFQKVMVDGVADRIFCTMIPIFLLSGILSRILGISHLVSALVWLISRLHVSSGIIPMICFLMGVLLSSATGSCAGTCAAMVPIMLPLATQMGCNIGLTCGAILSGGCFGDNLAPISDTTIASSLSQEIDVSRVVRSRFKYSIVAGIPTTIAFMIAGLITTESTAVESLMADGTYVTSLAFLIVPVLVVVFMLKTGNFFTSIIISEIVGVIMLACFGFITFGSVFSPDGLIASGCASMLNAIVFMIFIFIVVALIRDAGVLDMLRDALVSRAKSETAAESAAGAMVCLVAVMIGSGTSSIVFCGPIIRGMLRPFKIERARAANFLDGLGCGTGYLIPYNAGVLNLAALAIATGVVTEAFSGFDFIMFNFYSMALFIVYWVAILSGWGRKHETDEELAADGIVI